MKCDMYTFSLFQKIHHEFSLGILKECVKPMINGSTFVELEWDLLKGCCDLLNTHSAYVEHYVRILARFALQALSL